MKKGFTVGMDLWLFGSSQVTRKARLVLWEEGRGFLLRVPSLDTQEWYTEEELHRLELAGMIGRSYRRPER